MYKSFDEIKIRPKYFANQTQSIQCRAGHTGHHTEGHTYMQTVRTHTDTTPRKTLQLVFEVRNVCPGASFLSLVPPLKYIFIFCCINFIFGMFRGFPVCPQAYFMYNFNTVSIHMCLCVCYRTAFMYACVWVPRGYLIYKGL